MTAGTEPDDGTLAELLRRAEASIEMPADVWERTRAPHPARSAKPRKPILAAVATAALLVGGAFGGGLLVGRHQTQKQKQNPLAGSARPAMLAVFNVETACRPLRTIECSLGIRDRPSKKSAVVGRVWHGDQVWATCVNTDGDLVSDEAGVTSKRWYRVTLRTTGTAGWLPGVRTRNTVEIPACPGRP